MSWTAWALIGFAIGWAIQLRVSPAGATVQNDGDPPPGQSFTITALLRIMAGANAVQTPAAEAPAPAQTDSPASPDDAPPNRPPDQTLGWLAILACLALTVGAALEHDFGGGAGYRSLEEIVGTSRLVWMLIWLFAGYLASAHRATVAARGSDFFNAVLGKGANSSWPLQVAAALLLVSGIVLLVQPDIMRKLQSIKAGDVEAKFVSAGLGIRQARISLNDVKHDSDFQSYEGFLYFPKSTTRSWFSQIWQDLESQKKEWKSDRTSIRLKIAEFNDVPAWKLRLAEFIFAKMVYPFIDTMKCLRLQERRDLFRKDMELADIAQSLSNIIRAGQTPRVFETLFDLHIALKKKRIQLTYDALSHGNFGTTQAQLCIFQRLFLDKFDDVFSRFLNIEQYQYNSIKNDVTSGISASNTDISFWDPYFIGVVSDFLAFTQGEREKAIFLSQWENNIEKQAKPVKTPVPGIINFYYQIVDSKMASGSSWPLQKSMGEISRALDLDKQIMHSNELKLFSQGKIFCDVKNDDLNTCKDTLLKEGAGHRNMWDEIEVNYSSIEVYDLAQALQLLNDRVLGGDILSDGHVQRWKQWLVETRAILALLSYDALSASVLSPDDLQRFIRTRDRIRSSAATGVKSAAYNAALSIILVAERDGSPSAADCAAARSLMNLAEDMIVPAREQDELNETDSERSRGLHQQITNRIDISCGG